MYRFHDLPQCAIQLEDYLKSISQCEQVGGHFACTLLKDDEKCNIAHFYNCPVRTEGTPETVYVREVADYTFVATDPQIHANFTLEQQDMQVPAGGAFLISFSFNDTLKIASQTVKGRHIEHIVHNITMMQKFECVTHWELYTAVKGHMEQVHAKEIHEDLYDRNFFSFNFLYWITHINYLPWY